MYVKHLDSRVQRPNRELKGFMRVTLRKNETRTVTFPLKASALAWWDEKLPGFRVEKDHLAILIGRSATDTQLSTRVTLH